MSKHPLEMTISGLKNLKEPLMHRLALEELVTSLSSRFINNLSGQIEAEIPGALQSIAELMEAERIFIVLLAEDEKTVDRQFEWSAPNLAPIHRDFKQLSSAKFQWAVDKLRQFEAVNIPSLEDLPGEASSEREMLQTAGIKSFVCVPLTGREKLAGFMGLSTQQAPYDWSSEDARLMRFLGEIMVNVLNRRQTEVALRESEERYRGLFENLPIGFYRTTLTGKILDVNPALVEMLGYPDRGTLLEANVVEIFLSSSDRLRQHTQLEKEQIIRQYEIQMRCFDGRIIWVRDTARVIRGPDGTTLSYEGSLEDITESKRIELALRNSEERFRNIFDLSPYGIALLDQDGSIIDCNLETAALCGYAAKSELVGKKIEALLCKRDAESYRETIQKTLELGSIKNSEFYLMKKDGTEFPAELSYSLIKDTPGRQPNIIVVINDTTLRKRAEGALKETQKQMAEQVGELRSRALEISNLTEMVNMLQICAQQPEAYAVVEKLGRQLFPALSGAMLILDEASGGVEARARWGNPSVREGLSNRDDCWGLRRGRAYMVRSAQSGPYCAHIGERTPSSYLCTPIIAQGTAIGLLYLEGGLDGSGLTDAHQQLAAAVAEQIGLALSNLRLRENLREQAIRDPLTGLYNRYYMEESLDRELNRAARSGKPVGVIMLDLDHFKDLNTRFGHPNVDVMLREFGKLLHSSIRSGDIACRYGGDEFLLILPEASLVVTQDRAEQLRQQVKKLTVRNEDLVYDTLTISVGVASWPQHGSTTAKILQTVDAALLQAKLSHDCVVTAQV
jgi:diguanylate cyclase (GGDEF)-like protein/PAS domain S-box-containing protein